MPSLSSLPSQLNKRVRVEHKVSTPNGSGGSTLAWSIVEVIWAGINTGAGRSFWEQKRLNPQLSHMIHIRYRPDVQPVTTRIVFGKRVFKIHGVENVMEGQREMILACEEEVAVT